MFLKQMGGFIFLSSLLICSFLRAEEKKNVPFHRGVVLPLYGDAKSDYSTYLKEIADLKASHVSLLIRSYLQDNESNHILTGFGVTPPDYLVESTAAQARALGLKVMIFPVVFLAFPKSDEEWRGNLKPSNWEEWWNSYRCFMLHYAHLATRCQASVLSVGSELATTEGFREQWISLIAEVRTIFTGELTYSANWDHFEEVSFADALDFLGVSGYYEIAVSRNPTKSQLTEKWQKFLQSLIQWSSKHQKPLVFTELGYASQNGCASKPWNYFLSEVVDLQEQDLCFEVFFEVWEPQNCFSGVYLYHWWGEGGPTDNGYNLRGKPVAKRIQEWFEKMHHKLSTQ